MISQTKTLFLGVVFDGDHDFDGPRSPKARLHTVKYKPIAPPAQRSLALSLRTPNDATWQPGSARQHPTTRQPSSPHLLVRTARTYGASPTSVVCNLRTNLLSQFDSNTKSEAHASEVSTVRFPCRARIFEILKSRRMVIVYVRISRGWMCG